MLSIHCISDERNSFWNPIKPASFDKLLAYVKQHYTVICFKDLDELKGVKTAKPLLILSFDDGYYDFYEFALPLLKKHSLTCNHNIVNDCANAGTTIWTQRLNLIFEHCRQHSAPLNIAFDDETQSISDHANNWMAFYLSVFKRLLKEPKDFRNKLLDALEKELSLQTSSQMMNWDQIRECAANGVEIGSHTYNHDSLFTIADKAMLNHEIIASKKEIEHQLGTTINVLALPNGQTGKQADDVIFGSNYKYVLYVDDKLNALPLEPFTDSPLKISRINLVDEPFPQIALRTELFHQELKKYV